MARTTEQYIPGSFRDPSGFLYNKDGILYRQINNYYRDNYDHLMNSGLHETLTSKKLLIQHEEVETEAPEPEKAYKIIRPDPIPFISYPYEWCFSQLKDAALTTFQIQKISMEFGMTLKDCSAYNIQFKDCRPVLIDTLSFEKYTEGQSWNAYRQACQHFLAPLALMSYSDIRLSQLLRVYIDGIPLDLASLLLPSRTSLNTGILSHIHLHSKSQKYFADRKVKIDSRKISRLSFLGFIDNLESTIKKLEYRAAGTEWADYYNDTNYPAEALQHKKDIISKMLSETRTNMLWDLGANDGLFSRIASDRGIYTISFDVDNAAVEKNYLTSTSNNETSILPLLLDLTNPSPAIGWENKERMSLINRGPADTVFALALVHHLAISNNLPFSRIVDFFGSICKWLIIEFIPKDDSQVQRLLSTRKDIFTNYDKDNFEKEFSKVFNIIRAEKIIGSKRTLYLMLKNEN